MRQAIVALLGLTLSTAVLAQKLPDPDKVAPQYHDAAEKRRAEIIRAKVCSDKAEKEKVLKRDLASYINRCVDSADKAEAKTKQQALRCEVAHGVPYPNLAMLPVDRRAALVAAGNTQNIFDLANHIGSKVDAFGLFGGQIGYAWNSVLLYAKGGATVVDSRFDFISNATGIVGARTDCDTNWVARSEPALNSALRRVGRLLSSTTTSSSTSAMGPSPSPS